MPPKTNKQGNEEDDDFSSTTLLGKHTKMFFDHQKQKTLELNAEYWRFVNTRSRPMALKDTSTVWDVYLKWQEYQLEKSDKDDFSGIDIRHVQHLIKGQNNINGYNQKFREITASEIDVFKNYKALCKDEV
jgi:hypothetical protein